MAAGASGDLGSCGVESSGAKAAQRRAITLSLDQVVVMLSGKSLEMDRLGHCTKFRL